MGIEPSDIVLYYEEPKSARKLHITEHAKRKFHSKKQGVDKFIGVAVEKIRKLFKKVLRKH